MIEVISYYCSVCYSKLEGDKCPVCLAEYTEYKDEMCEETVSSEVKKLQAEKKRLLDLLTKANEYIMHPRSCVGTFGYGSQECDCPVPELKEDINKAIKGD